MKKCSKCSSLKKRSEFRFLKINKDGSKLYRARCLVCENKYYREKYRKLSSEERKNVYQQRMKRHSLETRRGWRIKSRFGITIEDYNKLLRIQNNRCYICLKKLKPNQTHIDHCHKTKKVRKLLCLHCNTGLGMFKDDIELFKKCISYIEEHA